MNYHLDCKFENVKDVGCLPANNFLRDFASSRNINFKKLFSCSFALDLFERAAANTETNKMWKLMLFKGERGSASKLNDSSVLIFSEIVVCSSIACAVRGLNAVFL